MVTEEKIKNDSTLQLFVLCNENENSYYAFSTDEKMNEWIMQQPFGENVLKNFKKVEELREYAEKSGAIAYFEKTGQVPDYYLTELNKICPPKVKSTEGVGFFYDGVFTGDAIVASTYPALWGWNNKLTAIEDLSQGFRLFDNIFFRKHLITFYNPLGFIHQDLSGTLFNNKTSSTFNW